MEPESLCSVLTSRALSECIPDETAYNSQNHMEPKHMNRRSHLLPRRLAFVMVLAPSLMLSVPSGRYDHSGSAMAEPPAPAAEPPSGTPISVASWSDQVWADALAGRTGDVLALWRQVPAQHAHKAVRELKASIDRLIQHLDAQSADRSIAFADSLAKAQEHRQANDLRAALEDAIVAHELSLDPFELLQFERRGELTEQPLFLHTEEVAQICRDAESVALQAEAAGQWLKAQDLWYRLSEFRRDEPRYREAMEHVSRRVGMIRLYNPIRLAELTNEQLKNLGMEPRPLPALPAGAAWQDQLNGVDDGMLLEGLDLAAREHLWQKGWPALLSSAFWNLQTLAETSDLWSVFPGLNDQVARGKFVAYVKSQREYWQGQERGSRMRASDALRALQRINANTIALPPEVLVYEFGEGALGSLDQFSDLVWPYETRMFNRRTEGNYQGVGIQITLDDSYRLKVVTPLEDTPAYRAGIRADDLISAIDGAPAVGLNLNQAIDRITGKAGTDVTITVERLGADLPLDFTLKRTLIKIDTVKGWIRKPDLSWDYRIDDAFGLGYVRINQFSPDTTADFDDAIADLKKSPARFRGLIVDLRFNPGGLLSEAIELSNRFVSDGNIVGTRDPGMPPVYTTAMPRLASGLDGIPVIVLVNEGSASASEIVAGCLRDHKRALVLGTRSYGKGSVQKVHDLAGGLGRLALTSQYFVLPEGEIIHREASSGDWGVDPNLVVRLTPDQIRQSIEMRQKADVVDAGGGSEELKTGGGDAPSPVSPDALFEQPVDLQLETALLLLRSRVIEDDAAQAMLIEGR